ncbi:uncharacterized protein EV420DRAFT_1749971 [Desarmillaria tabescens]|uniref:Uncharacterized protein n=1 Tax=Armillaria tabescens TaxID=1929756 RepID=A0AA39K2W4_ARMTA|nr:uncharacterized protein EV420DRAFT_1749971 [Desarmillaria tabescens]KAK0452169.1 hypothetical protein EV420DRAFT_1749971 [Desarmillaria tabescens]
MHWVLVAHTYFKSKESEIDNRKWFRCTNLRYCCLDEHHDTTVKMRDGLLKNPKRLKICWLRIAVSAKRLKPMTRPDPAQSGPEKPGPDGGLWRAQGSGSRYGNPKPWCQAAKLTMEVTSTPHFMPVDTKSPAKYLSPARPKPDPEVGFGGLRARAHTFPLPDPQKPSPSPKSPARPGPDITRWVHCRLPMLIPLPYGALFPAVMVLFEDAVNNRFSSHAVLIRNGDPGVVIAL